MGGGGVGGLVGGGTFRVLSGELPHFRHDSRSTPALGALPSRERGDGVSGIPCGLRFACSRPLTLREGDGVGVLCLFWVPACAGMTGRMVELGGFEPPTSSLRTMRSPN